MRGGGATLFEMVPLFISYLPTIRQEEKDSKKRGRNETKKESQALYPWATTVRVFQNATNSAHPLENCTVETLIGKRRKRVKRLHPVCRQSQKLLPDVRKCKEENFQSSPFWGLFFVSLLSQISQAYGPAETCFVYSRSFALGSKQGLLSLRPFLAFPGASSSFGERPLFINPHLGAGGGSLVIGGGHLAWGGGRQKVSQGAQK